MGHPGFRSVETWLTATRFRAKITLGGPPNDVIFLSIWSTDMRQINRFFLTCAAAITTCGVAIPASASTFFVGAGPVQPTSNVLFNGATTGDPLFGTLNDSPGLVTFTSSSDIDLTAQASGQARITGATDSNLQQLTFSSASGFAFSAVEFNLNALANGTATLIFQGADGLSTMQQIFAAGQNFFAATGSFTSVSISTNVQLGDVRQVRITAGPARGAVPEPATWAMMLVGFGAVGYGVRRRRQSGVVRFQAA